MRLLAVPFGMIVLPAYVLYRFVRTVFILGVALIIGIPLTVKYLGEHLAGLGIPLILNILISVLLVFPIATVLVPCGVAVALASLIAVSFIKFILALIRGVAIGITDGVEGVLAELRGPQPVAQDLEQWTLLLLSIASRGPEEVGDGDQAVAYQAVPVNFERLRARRQAFFYESLLVSHPVLVDEWAEEEEEIVKNVLLDYATNPPIANSKQANVVEALKNTYALYRELHQKWAAAFQELNDNLELPKEQRDYSKIENTLSPFDEISEPIVLVKEYQTQDGFYRAVPANIYLTDKLFLKNCIEARPLNPHNRDHLFNPERETRGEARGRPVRYRVYPLNEGYHSASFLDQEVQRMRHLLASSHLGLQDRLLTQIKVTKTPQVFFNVLAKEYKRQDELFLNDEFSVEEIEELFSAQSPGN